MSAAPGSSYRTWPVQLTVLGLVTGFGFLSRLPRVGADETAALAQRFKLVPQVLPANPVRPEGVVHDVNKAAAHLKYYMYQVGASAAMGDLDGDGLPNDLCLTDVRSKTLVIMPVPGTGERYPAFTVDLGDKQDFRTQAISLCRISDLNEDGLADLFVGVFARPPVLLLRKDPGDLVPGAPISMDSYAVRELSDDPSQIWWTATATLADLDGDGHKDIVIGNYFPDGAKVTDATSDEPFEMNDSFSRARNGGTNRIFLYKDSVTGTEPQAHYTEAPDPFPDMGARAWTLAIGAADLDHDGLQDLYISNDHGADQLLWNHSKPGALSFEELKGAPSFMLPESMAIGHDSFKGMGIDFADINDDGIFDMYVSNIASDFGLQETHFLWTSTGDMDEMKAGIAPWQDRGDDVGVAHSSWSWDSRFEDLDNDGQVEMIQATGFMKGTVNRWADLAQLGMGNDELVKNLGVWPKVMEGSEVDGHDPNPIWVLGKDGRYANICENVLPGLGTNSRGVALADVDGDGDTDMVYANLWEDSIYIKNDSKGGAFLGLHLLLPPTIAAPPVVEAAATEGAEAAIEAAPAAAPPTGLVVHDGPPTWREGVPAVGAYVEMTAPGGRKRIGQVDGGNGHSGMRAPDVVFGLGETGPDAELPVTIRWRDASGVEHNDALTLKPGWHTVLLASNSEGVTP